MTRSFLRARCRVRRKFRQQSPLNSRRKADMSGLQAARSPGISTGCRGASLIFSRGAECNNAGRIRREHEKILQLNHPASVPAVTRLPKEIFKAYDIRGIVGTTLTAPRVIAIGRAIGSEGGARGVRETAIGRDGRLSGPELAAALAEGIQAAGVD